MCGDEQFIKFEDLLFIVVGLLDYFFPIVGLLFSNVGLLVVVINQLVKL